MGQSTYAITGGAHFLVEPPIVDSALQKVYVFVGNDNSGLGHAHVLQTDTQLSSFAPEPVVGEGGADMFAGTFDNNYFTNPAAGFLYVCGYPTLLFSSPVLYRIGFNSAGKMNSTHDSNSLALASALVAGRCSPMTGFFNTTANKDWIFLSVANGCTASGGGTAGCVMSLDITSGFPALGTGRPEAGGTSAIIVDNVSAQPQASSIYFTTQSTSTCGDGVSGGGCAVKLTQSGLN